jgi:transcription antitermination factor NusG
VNAPWYAIWTRSRHEQVVRDQIEKKGFEAFLPTVARWSRWKDRKKKIDWPLFPGYCFARFNPDERLPILTCSGVVSIVSFDSEIAHSGTGDRGDPPAGAERSSVRSLSVHP